MRWKTLHRLGQPRESFERRLTQAVKCLPNASRGGAAGTGCNCSRGCPRKRLEDIERQIELVFSADYGRQLGAGCWEDSRLKILGVFGLCWSNCTRVHLWDDCISILGQISLREYEALHMPLQFSKV
ncbi:hypothetical protein Mapa_018573 [Marchantia paleacea]|nr:hypothetical protein Mapa_018573 [Marchantia paleacea]